MFNYVSIEFPLAENPPQRLSYFYLNLNRYAHEVAVVKFRDWDIKYTHIKPGEPVKVNLRGTTGARNFVGYIHDIKPEITPGKQFVEIALIGASYKLKQARQRVFTNMTASDIVRQIAAEHNFSAFVTDHPRVYPQVSQAGHTDLEIITRLAKQCGYTFRIQNTSIYFQPLTAAYTATRANAPSFVMRESNDPKGSTLYSFKMILGESVQYVDAYKSAGRVGGVDPVTKEVNIVTNKTRPESLRDISTPEFFDSFSTETVAPGYTPAAYEAQAIDQRNRFPYRAEVEVAGIANIYPDSPVYLAGIGSDYSGYWIVMSVKHKVIETEPNILTYTTILQVGTDSIGTANVWSDGKVVAVPDVIQIRDLVPDTLNKVSNEASLLTDGNTVYSNEGFGSTNNRPQPTTGKVPWVWQAGGDIASDNSKYVSTSSISQAALDRLRAQGVR